MNLEIDENDQEWSELRSELYMFFLTYWREIKGIYDEVEDFSELSELNEVVNIKEDTLFSKENLEFLVGRELELWKAMLALTVFFQRKGVSISKFTSSLSSLCSLVLTLAVDDAKQRLIENVTETGEVILLQILTQLVNGDDYYPVKTLKENMAKAFDEEQKWLTTRWIGSALRRLGFKEKRRVGTGYQYLLKKADIADLANRMGLPSSTPKKEPKKPDLKSVHWAEEVYGEHECCICGYEKLTSWQAETFKGQKLWICEDCKGEWEKLRKVQ